ncbi:MAG TPA: hypothetical protein VGE04_17810, partial [Chloroflexia bacterium]
MFRLSHKRLALLAFLGLVLQLLPTGVRARELTAALSLQDCSGGGTANATPFNIPYFGHPSFEKLWRRTDQLVARGQADRSWYWGPSQISGPIKEKLGDRTRIVQYFEKTRMEINDPDNHPDRVTNGLLSNELISGYMQVGENEFERHDPAPYVIAGDPDDPNNPNDDNSNPTYASFAAVSNTKDANKYQPNRLTSQPQPQYATATINRAGTVGNDARYAGFAFRNATQIVYFDSATRHNVPTVFWDYLNACGPIVQGGTVVDNQPINDPWWSASGLPISDAYWARVTLFGQLEDVLVQAFERRVLTYRPAATNPDFRVEMGNIGAHYVQWRYPRGVPGQAEVWRTTRDGGNICRRSSTANCPPAVIRSPYSSVAYYEDTIQVNNTTGSTVNARAAGTNFRLDKGSAMHLQPRVESSLIDTFLLSAGTALFSHDGTGDVAVEAGDTIIVPIGTVFSVQLRANGSVKVAVLEGSLRVTTADGQERLLGQQGKQEQLVVPPSGPLPPSEPLDIETVHLWSTFGGGVDRPNVDVPVPPSDISQCAMKSETYTGPPNERLGCPLAAPSVYSGTPADSSSRAPLVIYGSGARTGFLAGDTQGGTVYAVLPGKDGGPGTWESYSSTTLPAVLETHPELKGSLDAPTLECASA